MITKQPFGSTASGQAVELYRMENADGSYAEIITYGAALQSLAVPDKNGTLADVTVGFDDIAGHEQYSNYQGMTVGRYANRIAGGVFSLDGQRYSVIKNEKDRNCLHGGGEFSHVVWAAEILGEETLRLTYTSPDGAFGFPGTVEAQVTYRFCAESIADGAARALVIDYKAVSDRKTVLNLTNHTYFNLSGRPERDILGHEMQIQAETFTPADEHSIPTGELRPVHGTAFDFTELKPIGRDIRAEDTQLIQCKGYDHNLCLRPGTADTPAVLVREPESGRVMEVYTDLPGVQLYTGNFLAGAPGKGGAAIQAHAGFCLETQHYPDTPNQPAFPQCTFEAGEAFCSRTKFLFRVEKE